LIEHDAQAGKYYQKIELQQHVVVSEPDACYLTYVAPQDGRGITIANAIYDTINQMYRIKGHAESSWNR